MCCIEAHGPKPRFHKSHFKPVFVMTRAKSFKYFNRKLNCTNNNNSHESKHFKRNSPKLKITDMLLKSIHKQKPFFLNSDNIFWGSNGFD